MNEPIFSGFGIVTGTSSALAFPATDFQWARIKVVPSGVVGYIGNYGTANFPLAAGDDTGWFSGSDMSEFYYRGTGSYFSYWWQA